MKCLLAALLAGLTAQQPTFKSTTSLVEVDIIARDKDTSSYYVLAYSPENSVLDGKYRRILLKTKWSGLQVRARRGYVASPLPANKQLRITK
jgi:hypothetical protein